MASTGMLWLELSRRLSEACDHGKAHHHRALSTLCSRREGTIMTKPVNVTIWGQG